MAPEGKKIAIESILLAVTRITTLAGTSTLSNATGFFFSRDEKLFLITNRHVVLNEATNHKPERLEIELHIDPDNVAVTAQFTVPLYQNKIANWRQGKDSAGSVDVVAVPIDRSALPKTIHYHAFTPQHLVETLSEIEVGSPVLIVGFPLGFEDTLHHLPVARNAVISSSFGIRFQGHGYFLTDARLHRGTSGAPVVMRTRGDHSGREELAWHLLGVHAARMDVTNRDEREDERLSLNCAWYADILMTLTEDPPPAAPAPVVHNAPLNGTQPNVPQPIIPQVAPSPQRPR